MNLNNESNFGRRLYGCWQDISGKPIFQNETCIIHNAGGTRQSALPSSNFRSITFNCEFPYYKERERGGVARARKTTKPFTTVLIQYLAIGSLIFSFITSLSFSFFFFLYSWNCSCLCHHWFFTKLIKPKRHQVVFRIKLEN